MCILFTNTVHQPIVTVWCVVETLEFHGHEARAHIGVRVRESVQNAFKEVAAQYTGCKAKIRETGSTAHGILMDFTDRYEDVGEFVWIRRRRCQRRLVLLLSASVST